MQDFFDFLANAYTITIGDRLLPTVGKYRVGAVAVIAPDEEDALQIKEQVFDGVLKAYQIEPTILRVGDPFQFMRRAAGEGLAGIENAYYEDIPVRYMFMVRVEEAGSMLPTVLASTIEDTWGNCFTRAGVQQLNQAELLHWQRYDILDPASKGSWGESPFRDWKQGDPLYELRSETHVVVLSDVPLLGDWNSPDGSFAFFTTKEQAIEYHQNHLGDGKNRMIPMENTAPLNSRAIIANMFPRPMRDLKKGSSAFFTPKQRAIEFSQNLLRNVQHRMVPVTNIAPQDSQEIMANVFPRRVFDLRIRLHQLTKINLNAAWCVNPNDHRENSAYGRFVPFNLGHGTARTSAEHTFEILRLSTVSGTWRILPNNHFEPEEPLTHWSGYDTIGWSGGQSIQLLPLDRSFVHETGLEEHDVTEDLTDSEVEELVAASLDTSRLVETAPPQDVAATSNFHHLEPFVVVCWDTVTGEGSDHPLRFPSFFAAIRHLAAYEREHDQLIRVDGAGSEEHIGFPGSNNIEFEDLRSQRFKLGLKRLILRMIRRKGYRPTDAADLVSLCNGTLRTLHVDYAGYIKDLVWASSTDQQAELLQALAIPEDIWDEWTKQTTFPVDSHGERLALERIDIQSWNMLEPKTRHFISTALHQLVEQGSAPQLDYAPISIEVVKGLEVEMGALLADFRQTHAHVTLQFDKEDIAEEALAKYLKRKKLVTLGNLPYLLERPTPSASALRRAFHHYIESLPNREFLLQRSLIDILHRVVNTYRNGGAHDSAIRETVCRECVETLVGSKESPGLITQFAMWKFASSTSIKETV